MFKKHAPEHESRMLCEGGAKARGRIAFGGRTPRPSRAHSDWLVPPTVSPALRVERTVKWSVPFRHQDIPVECPRLSRF